MKAHELNLLFSLVNLAVAIVNAILIFRRKRTGIPAEWSTLSNIEIQLLAPTTLPSAREVNAYCFGFRRCAKALSADSPVNQCTLGYGTLCSSCKKDGVCRCFHAQ